MAEERARVRDPEPVARVILEPLEVVEVAAVRDRLDAGGAEVPHLLRDRVRDGDDGVGPPRDEACDRRLRALLDPHGEAVDPPIGVGCDRVAQIGDPRNAGRLLDGGADQVERRRRRGRHDDVDLLLLDDAACRRDRGQAPADELVRHEQPPGKERRLPQHAIEPLKPMQLLPREPPAGADVAHAVHRRLRRHRELVVAVEPLRVVRREDMGLDPELRQVGRELQRPADTAAAGGWEVHRDEQHPHRAQRLAICGRREGARAYRQAVSHPRGDSGPTLGRPAETRLGGRGPRGSDGCGCAASPRRGADRRLSGRRTEVAGLEGAVAVAVVAVAAVVVEVVEEEEEEEAEAAVAVAAAVEAAGAVPRSATRPSARHRTSAERHRCRRPASSTARSSLHGWSRRRSARRPATRRDPGRRTTCCRSTSSRSSRRRSPYRSHPGSEAAGAEAAGARSLAAQGAVTAAGRDGRRTRSSCRQGTRPGALRERAARPSAFEACRRTP